MVGDYQVVCSLAVPAYLLVALACSLAVPVCWWEAAVYWLAAEKCLLLVVELCLSVLGQLSPLVLVYW
jgi:hypothetical protein